MRKVAKKSTGGKPVYPLLASLCLAAVSSFADVFYWQGGATSFADYTDVSSWKVLSAEGEVVAADRIPGERDMIWTGSANGGTRIGYFNLGGTTNFVDGWSAGITLTDWKNYLVDLTNGTLSVGHPGYQFGVTNGHGYVARRFTLWDGAALVYRDVDTDARLLAAGGLSETWTLKSGSRMEVYGKILLAGVSGGNQSVVDPGATLVFRPAMLGTGTTNPNGHIISNSGTFIAEEGIQHNTLSFSNSGTEDVLTFRQLAGRMLLGGDFAKTVRNNTLPTRMTLELSGGTLEITNSVSFYTADAAKTLNNKETYETQVYATMPDGASATVLVDANSSIDMSIFTYGAGASVVKTGPGRLTLGATRPSTLEVREGSLFFGTPMTSLEGIALSSDTTLGFAATGNEIADIPGASSLRFTVDDSYPAAETVLTSSNAPLLEAVRAHFDVPSGLSGYAPYVLGDKLVLVDSAANEFMSVGGEYDIGTALCWTGGVVPSGAAAVIRGEDTVAVLSDDSPSFSAIEVKGGATLKITATRVDLPSLSIGEKARIVLCEGSWASLSNEVAFAGTDASLPVFEICTNATLAVPAATEFKNVDLRNYGTIDVQPYVNAATPSANDYIAFGTSRKGGETTYFSMTSIGGTVRLVTGSDKAQRFVYAENGGCVRVKGKILIKDYTHDTGAAKSKNGAWFGYGNPTNAPFEVVIDNSDIDIARSCAFGGGGTLRFINGSRLLNPETHPWYNLNFTSLGMLRLVFEDGSGFRFPRSHRKPTFNAGYPGTETVVLGAGGWFDSHETQGDGKAAIAVSNGVWCVDALPVIPYDIKPGDALYPADGDVRNWTTSLFAGFHHVRIERGASLYLASANRFGCAVQQDRFAVLSDVPITGEGGLVVSNGVPGYGFSAVMVSGANTATGRLKALPSDDPAVLFFNDGANWAGTVECGPGVAFTNLVDAAAPASVSVGGLDLADDLKIRYWKRGSSLTNDTIAIGAAVTGEGKIVPVRMDGEKVAPGETLWLGQYPSSAALPADSCAQRGWRFVAKESSEQGGVVLGMTYDPAGFTLIFR